MTDSSEAADSRYLMIPCHPCRVAFCDVTLIALIYIAGCSYAPPEGAVKAAVAEHFESRSYRVREMSMDKIGRIPLSEREYMSPRTYVVEISSITLETMRDVGESWNYKKGRILVFRGASLRIRAGSDTDRKWVVGSIHGIPVP